ncbi:MAG: AAA family ATPase [Oligoflexia bacterium]|nr:AAA family ATPase [Oligoflexia bacterium]
MNKLLLESITVKNFATFENQKITFQNNYNAIAGETGSGKSLILDAFQFLLGQRADKRVVRKNASTAVIEGIFTCEDDEIKEHLEKIGYPVFDNQIIIKRIINSKGQSKSSLNDLSCSLSTLSEFSRRYIDLVGQFENQKLLSPSYQIKLLDTFSGSLSLLNDYQSEFEQLNELYSKKEALEANLSQREERIDYVNFQLSQLNSIELDSETEKRLISIKNSHLNAEKKSVIANELSELINSSDNSLASQLQKVSSILQQNLQLFSSEVINTFEEIKANFDDLSYDLTNFDQDDFDEEDLDSVLDQLDVLQKLKRKFNVDTTELAEIKNKFENELSELNDIEKSLLKIKSDINTKENLCWDLANQLHEDRLKSAKKLSKEITKGVQELNMKGATIDYVVTKSEALNKYGLTIASISAETNPGEGYFNLKDIASGGELSRVLLTLRRVVSKNDTISIFFFDEIDTGIGGETAKKIANMLKAVSGNSQVIAITHLPQLATLADCLIVVDKMTIQDGEGQRTVSSVNSLTGKKQQEYVSTLAGL